MADMYSFMYCIDVHIQLFFRPWECGILDAPTSETQQFSHLPAPSTCGYVTIPLKMKRVFSAYVFCISYTVCMII